MIIRPIREEFILDVDWIIKNAIYIHYFGLGFIQVKLNNWHERVHFYSDQLPITVGEEEIHNHRYNFESIIIKGTLQNIIYEIQDIVPATHILSDESCDSKIKLKSEPTPVSIIEVHNKILNSGDTYPMDHTWFHTVKSKNAITYLQRSMYKKDHAQVIRPIGADLICPFSENLKMSKLIEHIEYLIDK